MNDYDEWMLEEAQDTDPTWYWQQRRAEDDEAEKAGLARMEAEAGPCPFCRHDLSYNMMTDAMECGNCGAEWGDPDELATDQRNAAALRESEARQ